MLAEECPDNAGYRTFRHGNPCNTDMRLLSLPSTENPYHRMLKNPQRRHVRHIPWPSAGRSNAVEMKVDRTLVHIVDDNATFRKTIEGRLEQFVTPFPLILRPNIYWIACPTTPHRVVSFSTFGCL